MKRIMLGLVMLMLISVFASGQDGGDAGGGGADLTLDTGVDEADISGDDMDIIKAKLKKIINILQYIAGFIAAIAAIITGIMFMTATDPSQKRQMGDRLKNIIIGLVIVVLSIPIVNLIIG